LLKNKSIIIIFLLLVGDSLKVTMPAETNSVASRMFSAQFKRYIKERSTISKDGAKCEVSVPGISYADFDRGGMCWFF